MPTMAERKSTIRGVEVLIIEPSIGEVFARPNIIHSLRATPINIAAPNIFSRSADSTFSGRSHKSDTNDSNAAITNEADTIAIGEMYRPNTRL